MHRLKENCSSFLTGAPAESDDTRACIYIQLRRRPSEDEQGNARNM